MKIIDVRETDSPITLLIAYMIGDVLAELIDQQHWILFGVLAYVGAVWFWCVIKYAKANFQAIKYAIWREQLEAAAFGAMAVFAWGVYDELTVCIITVTFMPIAYLALFAVWSHACWACDRADERLAEAVAYSGLQAPENAFWPVTECEDVEHG